MYGTYHLWLFGSVKVEREGVVVNGFVSRKAVALLGYLVTIRKPVSRSHLAHLFWGDKSETRGRANLSRVLNNLTDLLPGCLQADYHAVQLNQQAITWSDISTFDTQAKSNRTNDLIAAINLYRDRLMAELTLSDCPEFEAWLITEQEYWHHQAIQTLQKLVAYYHDSNQYSESIRYLSRWLALDPWREEAHQQMMLSLVRTGQRSAALLQFETCKRVLKDELGVQPSNEVFELYQRIRGMEEHPSQRLPLQSGRFIGRQTELAAITKRLDDSSCRLLTLTGPGGIGKTRLAIEAAHQIISRKYVSFLHGVHFISVTDIESVQHLAIALVNAFQIPIQNTNSFPVTLIDFLRNKELLLILDNFEHLLSGKYLLKEILQEAPQVKLLVTSRIRLNLKWEWLLEVPGLAIPGEDATPLDIHNLAQYEAVKLLQEAIRRVTSNNFPQTIPDLTAIVRVCRLVEGMPLALELAAGATLSHPLETVAERLEQSLDILKTPFDDVPPRHQSLYAVFDYSWQLLTAEEQVVFQKLSVFHDGFTFEAAKQVCGASSQNIFSLTEKSYLQLNPTGRYSSHDLLRRFAREKLHNIPEVETLTEARHCTFFIYFLQQRDLSKGGNQQKSLLEIETEIDNIRYAWNWILANLKFEEIQKGLHGLFAFYELSARFWEGQNRFTKAIDRLQNDIQSVENKTEPYEQWLILGQLLARGAWFTWRLGQFRLAQTMLHRARETVAKSKIDASVEIAFIFNQQSLIDYYLGDFVKAKQTLQECMMISQNVNDPFNRLLSLLHYGLVAAALGEYDLARGAHEESITICRQLDERRGLGIQLICLGAIAYILEEYGKAEQQIFEGTDTCLEIGDRFGIALGLNYLGILAWVKKEYVSAEALLDHSLILFEAIGDQWGIALTNSYLGRLKCTQKKYSEAKMHLDEALSLSTQIEVTPVRLLALLELTQIYFNEGRSELALFFLFVILHHPASWHVTRQRANHILVLIRASFSTAEIAMAEKEALAKVKANQI